MSGRNQAERSIASKRAGMSEQPIYASTGIVVTPQMVTIKGQSYAVRPIAGVSYRTTRTTWMKRLLWGCLLLASALLVFSFNIGCVNGECSGYRSHAESTFAIVSILPGLFGLGLIGWGGVPLLYGMLNSKAGNYLELSTSDGRRNEIWGLKPAVARDVKSAIEQAIVRNGRGAHDRDNRQRSRRYISDHGPDGRGTGCPNLFRDTRVREQFRRRRHTS